MLGLSASLLTGLASIKSMYQKRRTKVNQYILAHVNREHVCFVGTTTTKKYRKAEYVLRRVCFVNVQSSLHENVVVSVFARMDNATFIKFIMWNSIYGLDAWYHFRFNIRSGVAVIKQNSGNFLRGGEGANF